MLRSTFTRHNNSNVPHFNAGEHNEFITVHGLSAYYWKANLCACEGARSAYPNLSCGRCEGRGFWYSTSVQIKTSALGDNTKRIVDNFGLYEPGDLMATIPTRLDDDTRILMSIFDRLYFPTRIETNNDKKVKGELRADQTTAERIWSPSVSRVLTCSDVLHNYVYGTDFTLILDVNNNGTIISWLPDGNHPQETEKYTIQYEASPFYHVADIKYRGENDSRLQQLVKLAKVWSPAELFSLGNKLGAIYSSPVA